MLDVRIGFIGCGQMAQALAGAWVDAGLVGGARIWGYDPSAEAAGRFAEAVPDATLCAAGREVAGAVQVVVVAVKPQQMAAVYDELRGTLSDAGQLVMSIAAGVTLEQLARGFGTERLVRVMPNTPCLIREGACCFALGRGVVESDGPLAERLLAAVGRTQRVDESLLDAVTGLSGSGPAYVYLIIEALSDGGVRMGLPREVATELAAQTVRGAAGMVLTTGLHPGVLKDRVTSPGGTTMAGLTTLERRAVRGALIEAVETATRRSVELSRLDDERRGRG